MQTLLAIPRADQHQERWANGAGSTTVILREPDSVDWHLRVSVAKVEQAGPFSELPDTRRTLVPLDAPMTLCFPDGHAVHARRMQAMRFAGSPAPTGCLPEGPTRDFNLMLRGDARGEVIPRTLAGCMLLPPEPGTRWLVYLDSGAATLGAGDTASVQLGPGDAAVLNAGPPTRGLVDGAGEIVLVKLYA